MTDENIHYLVDLVKDGYLDPEDIEGLNAEEIEELVEDMRKEKPYGHHNTN